MTLLQRRDQERSFARLLYQRYLRGLRTRTVRKIRSAANRILLAVRDTLVRRLVLPGVYSKRINRDWAPFSNRSGLLFLVLRHKYVHGDPRFGESIEEHNLSGPLRSTGIADSVEYFYDTDRSGWVLQDSNLVKLVTQVRPDLLILSGYSPYNKRHPQVDVLRAIHNKCRIPILAIWSDSDSEASIRLAGSLADVVDLNVEWGSGTFRDHFSDKDNFLRLWAPLDFSVFHPGNELRDIPVSFLGNTLGYHNDVRRKHLDYLNDYGVEVHRSGGAREQLLTLDSYADLLRRSRISLNFSHSAPGSHQMKARVLEVMFSGAMLLENVNDQTSQFFTPMVDYVPFDSEEDLLVKIGYYLDHDEERERIAQNGYLKATREYNHEVFWNIIMNKLEELELLSPRVTSPVG